MDIDDKAHHNSDPGRVNDVTQLLQIGTGITARAHSIPPQTHLDHHSINLQGVLRTFLPPRPHLTLSHTHTCTGHKHSPMPVSREVDQLPVQQLTS